MGAILPLLTPLLDKLLGAFLPDPQERQKFILQFMQQAAQLDTGQLDVNKAEAANPSLFVAGARPFILWVCGFALIYQYLVVPFALWGATIFHHPIPTPPVLDDNLWQLMFGMLGMAGWRSLDKIKGVDTKSTLPWLKKGT